MKLINKTAWRTDQLKAIIQRVALDELQPMDRKRMRVTIVYGRGRHFRRFGCAPYGWKADDAFTTWNSGKITLYLDRDGAEQKLAQLAHTVAHEFAHTRGLRHRDMYGPRYNWDQGWQDLYAWANEFPLEKQLPKVRPSQAEKDAKKHTLALAQMARIKTKIKRSNTALKF